MIEAALPALWSRPLFGTTATRQIERAAMAALPPHTLMQRAGDAVAGLALALAPHARRVWIASGPGNNGGDGLQAAIALRAAGRDVRVTLLGADDRRPDDARDALRRAREAGVPIGDPPAAWFDALDDGDLAIDALLGLGAARPPAGEVIERIRQLTQTRAPVLAVDLPTGLSADHGAPLGPTCVGAAHTLALLTLKPGLFTASGRDLAGRVWLADLGVTPGDVAPGAMLAGGDTLARLRRPRAHARHKGSYGDLAVVGGAAGMTGAAVLAARAGAAAGAGRCFVQALDADAPSLDATHPELMWRRTWLDGPRQEVDRAVVVAGCGGGDAVRAVLPRLLGRAPRLVLDADAINAIAFDTALATQLTARASRGAATVLTPHPLEAARLLGVDTGAVQADRLGAARELATRHRALVVLKGSGSIVATPDGHLTINASGSAALACAGTGDVLAGWIGGAWAEAGSGAAPVELVVACVALHGLAGESAVVGPIGASALIETMQRLRNAA